MADQESKLAFVKVKMREALFLDRELNKSGKPSLNKLNSLDGILGILYSLRNVIDTETLQILKEWLEPLPDNSLPNVRIKSGILSFLLKINVTRDQLVVSEIGKIIYFYSLNDGEGSEVKNMSKQIVKKWTMVAVQDQLE